MKMISRKFVCTTSGFAIGLAALASPAAAQAQDDNTAQTGRTSGLQDIVVTATRRAERLQDVPIAVTALSSEALDAQGIDDVSGIQRAAPGLNIAPFPGDPGTATVSLRGLIATEALPTIDPAVGLYLDGVYIARATGANLNLIDVERAEVLRGPQGTLFGRNTIGGAINIITKKPTDTFEGEVSAGYGNYDAWNISGVLNAPVSENLSVRLAASHKQRDGFARSSLTGTELGPDNTEYLRLQLAYRFSDNWDLLLSGDWSDTRFDGAQWVTPVAAAATSAALIGLVPPDGDTPADYNLPYTHRPPSNSTEDATYRNTVWGVGGTLTGEYDAVTIKAIVGYRDLTKELEGNDLDGFPYILLQQIYGYDYQDQFSAELQLFGKALDGRLDWIVGAYHFTEDGINDSLARFLFPFVVNPNQTYGATTNKSSSVFGQITYNLTEQLRATAGLRHVRDTRKLISQNRNLDLVTNEVLACTNIGATTPDCLVVLEPAKFDYVPFTLGLDYKPSDDVLLFAKFSRGFRAGGFNLRGNDDIGLAPFGPEKLDSFEVGFKADLFDRMLRLNVTGYHSIYNDIQVSTVVPVVDPGTGTVIRNSTVVQNAGKARIDGLEAEATLVLGNFRLGGTLGYTDHKYKTIGANVIGIELDSPPILIPKLTTSLTADYKVPTSFGSVSLHGDYTYRSKVYFAAIPQPNPGLPPLSQDGVGLLGAVVTAHLDNPDLDVSAWVRNLTDKEYNQRSVDFTALGYTSFFPGDPRTYGVSVKYRF